MTVRILIPVPVNIYLYSGNQVYTFAFFVTLCKAFLIFLALVYRLFLGSCDMQSLQTND